jgi:hypothetical protein
MSERIHHAVLDEMLLGMDEAEHRAAWKALLMNPGGADQVRDAARRRERVDLLAGLLRSHPWSAWTLDAWSQAKKLMVAPGFGLQAALPELALTGALEPDVEPLPERTMIDWGDLIQLRLRLQQRIAFTAPLDASVVWWYQTRGEDAPLPTAAWRLLEGESPVFIHAFATSSAPSSLEACFDASSAHALIVLEEDDRA